MLLKGELRRCLICLKSSIAVITWFQAERYMGVGRTCTETLEDKKSRNIQLPVTKALQERSSLCLLVFLSPHFVVKDVVLRAEKKWGCAPSVVVCVEKSWEWDENRPVESWVQKKPGLGCLSCGIERVLWLLGSLKETQAENQLLEILIHVVPWYFLCLKKTYFINSLNNFRHFRVATTKFGCNLISTKRCRRSLLLVYNCFLLTLLTNALWAFSSHRHARLQDLTRA